MRGLFAKKQNKKTRSTTTATSYVKIVRDMCARNVVILNSELNTAALA